MRNCLLTRLLHLFYVKKKMLALQRKDILKIPSEWSPFSPSQLVVRHNGCRADSFAAVTVSDSWWLWVLGFYLTLHLNLEFSQKLSQESAAVCKCGLSSSRVCGPSNIQINCPIENKSIEVKELDVKAPLTEGHDQGLDPVSRRPQALYNQSAHSCPC